MNHGIGIIAHKMCCFILCVCYAGFAQGQALSSTDPSDKTATNGNIVIHGLVAGTAYNISYTKDGTNVPAAPFNADDGGNVILPALGIGTYTNFNIVKPAIAAVAAVPAIPAAGGAPAVPAVAAVAAVPATTTILPNSVVLVPNTIAVQATKFFGAVYGNFTGVPDDDPTSFVQTYARLSQPLNGVDGIANNAPFKDRNIFFRNFIAQLTYGNTDNFKTYTVDTLGDKYTNCKILSC